jgi:hypothetical protein
LASPEVADASPRTCPVAAKPVSVAFGRCFEAPNSGLVEGAGFGSAASGIDGALGPAGSRPVGEPGTDDAEDEGIDAEDEEIDAEDEEIAGEGVEREDASFDVVSLAFSGLATSSAARALPVSSDLARVASDRASASGVFPALPAILATPAAPATSTASSRLAMPEVPVSLEIPRAA